MNIVILEKRRASRNRLLLDGKIVTLNNMSLIDRTVKDLSATGAKLRCDDPLAVPDSFRLWIPSRYFYRLAKVVWRRDMSCGIHFIGPLQEPPERRKVVRSMSP